MRVVRVSLPALILLAAPILAGCADNGAAKGGDDDQVIEVDSSADDCTLSRTEVPAGSLTFEVTNTGDDVTEFYLYAEDGERIVSEVENIGPGLSRELVAAVPAGSYVAACKPGMTGDGIRVDLVVTDSGESVEPVADEEVIEQASEGYGEYVREETDELVAATAQFVAAFTAGRDDLARSLYPEARTHWERIEPVAESFGELDPILDAREADLEPGQRWTGWHRLEKDLWPQRAEAGYTPLSPGQRTALADNLTANTAKLQDEIAGLTFTVDQIANGSRALMEEVATGKITGEEEYWSRTDLWDFQANVDGAREAFELLEPIVATKDPELEETLDDRFDALQALLDAQRDGEGFVFYNELTRQEVKTLADAVNALSEPLSELTSVVMS
jgi:iron uptake system component EfeO